MEKGAATAVIRVTGYLRNLRQEEECIRVVLQMNSILFCLRGVRRAVERPAIGIGIAAGICALALIPAAVCVSAQTNTDSSGEFKQLAAELSAARLSGTIESEVLQGKALAVLDELACKSLNSSGVPELDAANQRLTNLVSHTPPVGENYRLVRLAGNPAVYALVVNFGIGGPAAVRIYAGTNGRYALAAKIDRFTEREFFDSDIELLPASTAEPVFVIVGGRTDDLATGVFSAWRFDGRNAILLWSSDLLQQSSYEADRNGFHLTYCAQPDEEHPGKCPKMASDLYRWQGGQWKRVESNELPPAKAAK
jgi:hypothetical protein